MGGEKLSLTQEMNSKAIFFTANFKDTGISNRSRINTKAISKMGNIMGWGSILGAQATLMKETTKMEKRRAMVFIPASMGLCIKASGTKERGMGKEYKLALQEQAKECCSKWGRRWLLNDEAY